MTTSEPILPGQDWHAAAEAYSIALEAGPAEIGQCAGCRCLLYEDDTAQHVSLADGTRFCSALCCEEAMGMPPECTLCREPAAPASITYVTGNITQVQPSHDSCSFIVHGCNNAGYWGRGVSGAIGRAWPETERRYRAALRDVRASGQPDPGLLGMFQTISVDTGLWVLNLFSQHGIRYPHQGHLPAPIRYDALEQGLEEIAFFIRHRQPHLGPATVHMPRIGCTNAGGSWDVVEPIIQRTLCAAGIPVVVHDL
jgi:hypothetical protein